MYMCRTFIIHSSVGGHRGRAAFNTDEQVRGAMAVSLEVSPLTDTFPFSASLPAFAVVDSLAGMTCNLKAVMVCILDG